MTNLLFEGINIKPEIQQKILKDAEFYKGIEVVPEEFYVGASPEEGGQLKALEEDDTITVALIDIRYIDQPNEYVDVYWSVKVDKYPDWDIHILGHSYLIDGETGELINCYHAWSSLREVRLEAQKWKELLLKNANT